MAAILFLGGRVGGDVFMKLWVVVLVVLSLNPTTHQALVGVEGARNLSEEDEDLELEMQLKILNKPPVKTIHTEWGDILDCINIHQQPAFDHPLLKNHKIQMKPSSVPRRVRDVTSSFTDHKPKKSIFMTPAEMCPKGTVPIRRTQKEDLIKAKSLSSSSSRINSGGGSRENNRAQNHAGLMYQVIGETFYGATADIDIYNPIVGKGQFSSAEIALESGPAAQYNGIHFGWKVYPDLFRDNLTRTYTYWTGDGGHKTGCYNTHCSGFVQVHKQVTIGTPLRSSTYGSKIQYVHKVRVFQDLVTKHWWLEYDGNINVGYWPDSLFPHFGAGAQYIYWGGNVKAGGDGLSPQMGSGHYPDGEYTKTCFFAYMQYVNGSNVLLNPKEDNMVGRFDCRKWYGLKYYGFQEGMGHTFLFGGPGGKCD